MIIATKLIIAYIVHTQSRKRTIKGCSKLISFFSQREENLPFWTIVRSKIEDNSLWFLSTKSPVNSRIFELFSIRHLISFSTVIIKDCVMILTQLMSSTLQECQKFNDKLLYINRTISAMEKHITGGERSLAEHHVADGVSLSQGNTPSWWWGNRSKRAKPVKQWLEGLFYFLYASLKEKITSMIFFFFFFDIS